MSRTTPAIPATDHFQRSERMSHCRKSERMASRKSEPAPHEFAASSKINNISCANRLRKEDGCRLMRSAERKCITRLPLAWHRANAPLPRELHSPDAKSLLRTNRGQIASFGSSAVEGRRLRTSEGLP